MVARVAEHIWKEPKQPGVQHRWSSPIALCLFDLDETLLRTDDLEPWRGSKCVGVNHQAYTQGLIREYWLRNDRHLYTQALHLAWRERFPAMQWGVFTRAPSHYAKVLLDQAYPDLDWSCVIAYEDVRVCKPSGEGVKSAMRYCRIPHANQVMMVGDDVVDIYSGYHAGCWTVLDKSSWKQPTSQDHFPKLALVPDAVINRPAMLGACLESPESGLPEIEYRIRVPDADRAFPRLDRIYLMQRDGARQFITVMGRLFSKYDELKLRSDGHQLTSEVVEHKSASFFPEPWIAAIRAYLAQTCKESDPLVTVIPFKPGRAQRMEALLKQIQNSDSILPIRPGTQYDFSPNILAYNDEALSFHKNFLGPDQRFENAQRSLYVVNGNRVQGRQVIVIDDVVTTGASLYSAYRHLKYAGASRVACMALTKTISRYRERQ